VDDPLLMGVLHGAAGVHKQRKPLVHGQIGLIAVFGDWHTPDQFHHKVGTPGISNPGVERAGDVGMVHERQCLPLDFEPGQHLPAIHALLDDLECDPTSNRDVLLGHEDDAKAPFADLLKELVWPDDAAGGLPHRVGDGGHVSSGRGIQKIPHLTVGSKQLQYPRHGRLVAAARRLEIGHAVLGRRESARTVKDFLFVDWVGRHSSALSIRAKSARVSPNRFLQEGSSGLTARRSWAHCCISRWGRTTEAAESSSHRPSHFRQLPATRQARLPRRQWSSR
jgi:hypothetical protein